MGKALNRPKLLRQLSSRSGIAQAAFAIINRHITDHANRAMRAAGGYAYADDGAADVCDDSDDPEGYCAWESFLSNVRHRDESMSLDAGEGAMAAGFAAAEDAGAAEAGVAALSRFFTMLL